jgi:hypothetical protein
MAAGSGVTLFLFAPGAPSALSLSARSGEREGPVAKRWEGEVSVDGAIACAIATHLIRSLALAPSPPASGRRR